MALNLLNFESGSESDLNLCGSESGYGSEFESGSESEN